MHKDTDKALKRCGGCEAVQPDAIRKAVKPLRAALRDASKDLTDIEWELGDVGTQDERRTGLVDLLGSMSALRRQIEKVKDETEKLVRYAEIAHEKTHTVRARLADIEEGADE